MTDAQKPELLGDKEDVAEAISELIRLIESGEVVSGALRFRYKDGTEQDVVFGGETEEEREQALASLHALFATKH